MSESPMSRSDYFRILAAGLAAVGVWSGYSQLLQILDSGSWVSHAVRLLPIAPIAVLGAGLASALRPTVVAVCARAAISMDEASLTSRLPSIITGAVWGAIATTMFIGGSSATAAWLFLAVLAPWIVWIDLRVQRIPTTLAYLAAGGTAATTIVTGVVDDTGEAIVRALAAGAAAGATLFVLAVLLRGGIGLGDARLVVSLGMVLGYAGWVTLPAALIFAILAAFVGVVLARTIRMIRSEPAQSHIALGPFLALGSALALAVS
ncbi:hypothetical protein BJF84_24435 [Rhodococcus sp. CUA-806]|nr:hypothetical protein BJF84_24435 [Rhodococcus sp. CUA-806]